MAVNFLLTERHGTDPQDPMGRGWVGWDKYVGDDALWEVNRGLWSLAAGADGERFATLSHAGVIQVVAELTGREPHPVPGSRLKWALTGTVLRPGDPVHDELAGSPAPLSGNPVSYFDTARLDTMTTSQRTAMPAHTPSTMLLTWNPTKWRMDDYDADVKAAASGAVVRGRWSTGSRRGGIEPGDRVFMLRQGDDPRGIVGSGTCASRIHSGEH